MKHIEYKTTGTCAKVIVLDLDDNNIIHNCQFIGGCNGNLKAISKLLNGQSVEYIEEKLLGNDCRGRGTSCADQLAKAVREAYDSQK